ncbi:MAG: type I restriction endonuclease subunit R [Rickettsiaceae bacterium]|nr:type I restriction endonuclease subunit R [Rickettsiaceae bacterium]
MAKIKFNERYLSQIPALQLLITMGYKYLSAKKALAMRGGDSSNVLLEDILWQQLKNINRIHYKNNEYVFSENNIEQAVKRLKNVKYDGLLKTNKTVYDLITLGISLEQPIEGCKRSFTLNYIDWQNLNNNVFHVVSEYTDERSNSVEKIRPDIVLFVNGIPLCVIECKSPNIKIEETIKQHIRNQGNDYIPRFFTYVQIVVGINKNAAMYATPASSKKFWMIWRELENKDQHIINLVNTPLSEVQKDELFSKDVSTRKYFDNLEKNDREMTKQDNTIFNLCNPDRLLELSYSFTIFEAGIKKIASYSQFFVIRSAMSQIKYRNANDTKTGGMIWQCPGAGKSLIMVLLTRLLNNNIINPRIIIVSDRDDLDKQISETFANCGRNIKRATSGKNLVQHLKNNVDIITTLIHKFDKALKSEKYVNKSANMFVLVDESHRTNFGFLAARMRQMLPNSCYIGFTGTPLMTKEKNNFEKFGTPIEPQYSFKQAIKDGVVLPLLYEGRHVEIIQNKSAVDLWFERHTSGLTNSEKTDLKRKYATASKLNNADQVIYMRAFDISEHYRENWQGTGLKAQLVAPNKATALKYHEYLKEIGFVTSEVIISAPNKQEGYDEINKDSEDQVCIFWDKMMQRFGSEKKYVKEIINQFKHSEKPEILIVVDKLLTGFNAPRNTVLYLCRPLKEHTLLQAIFRVNRLYEGKDCGYIIDYANVLGELNKALEQYDVLRGFDGKDLEGAIISVNEKVNMLPQKYLDLWNVFCNIKNEYDLNDFERQLADEHLRQDFYKCLSEYSKILGIALSTHKFTMETDIDKLQTYKNDLKFFQKLKSLVKSTYNEKTYSLDHDLKIKKLLDTHIQAHEVLQLNKPFNIFDDQSFNAIKNGYGIYKNRSYQTRADIIVYASKKIITEKKWQAPAFYKKFSKLIQQAIDDFKLNRISEYEYFEEVIKIRNKFVIEDRDDVPDNVSRNYEASAYYGVIQPHFEKLLKEKDLIETIASKIALKVQNIFNNHWKVDFWNDDNVQKDVEKDIDDFLCDAVKTPYGVSLSYEQIDEIIANIMQIARNRRQDSANYSLYN